MPVCYLGRKADVVGHNGMCPFLAETNRRLARNPYLKSALRKKCKPEREMFIHPQYTWNTDYRGFLVRLCGRMLWRFVIKYALVLPFAYVHSLLVCFTLITEYLFALVARKIDFPVVKLKGGNLTMVVATFTASQFRSMRCYLSHLNEVALWEDFMLRFLLRMQCCPKCPHKLRSICYNNLTSSF